MDCDYENPIYDYSTFSGRTRRALRRLTWRNLAWGIPAAFIVILALILITTNSNHRRSIGQENAGVTLLLSEPEAASTNETTQECDEEQVLADEWELYQEIKNCLNPQIEMLLKAISIASRIDEKSEQKLHKNKTWTKENVVEPVCVFFSSIQCSKKEDIPKNASCANNETKTNFETYIATLSSSVCGSNKEKLLALLETGTPDCWIKYPTKIAECINDEFNNPFEDVKESESNRSCRSAIRVHQCLTQGAIECGGQAPTIFQTTSNGVQIWIDTKCFTRHNASSEMSLTEKPEALPESASAENETTTSATKGE